MAISVSPGVNVSEFDNTTVVPAVATSVGAFAGVFPWGPAFTRVLIDSENTLVKTFGKPDANTFESFFTAANFLAYGNALYVVRAYDAAALNSYANTGAVSSNPQLDNIDDFNATTLDANISYVAKYAGALGNSLKVSVCDSANAYSSNLAANAAVVFTLGSNTVTINAFSAGAAGTANALATSILGQITVGDYIRAGNSTLGYQYLKVTAKTGPVGAETTQGSNVYSNGVTLSVSTPFSLAVSSTFTVANSNLVQRNWEYYNAVPKAPGTSVYAQNLGLTTQDEIHVVVVDNGGKFTGTTGNILEVFAGLSRGTDAKQTNGSTAYYKNVLNLTSQYIYAGADRSGAASGLTNAISNSSTTTPYSSNFAAGVDSTAEGSIGFGSIALAYDLFRSKETVDISLVMQGKANGVGLLSNYIIGNIAEARKDCVAFVSPDSSIVTNSDPSQYAVNFRNSTGLSGITYNSSYAFMDGNYKYQYDKYNDLYRWVPLNGDIAGLCAATDFARDAWWSPAGFNRGQIKNVVKLAFNPNQGQRDLLYKNDVNPVITFPGQGTVLYGDKTLYGKPSAFDRINVRRLFIVLEKAISKAAQSSLFEFNDAFTRAQFKNLVDPYLREVQGRRGIYDYRVVCDETNNTAQIIDSNQFVGDIYIKPAKSINFIQLNFVAVRTGVDFNTIVGQF